MHNVKCLSRLFFADVATQAVISTSPKGNKDETIYMRWRGLHTHKMAIKYKT